jgi:hypothetical protein
MSRIRPLTPLVCGFDKISVSPLLTATKVTTVAADARVPIMRATTSDQRCTNSWRGRRV